MNQRGFSLVEVIVAMTILVVGVLGLAASSTAITRMTGEGGRQGVSSTLASSRIETLRAQAGVNCAGMSDGSSVTGGFTVSWRVTNNAVVSGLRDVTVTVTYNSKGATKTARYETQVSCLSQVQ